MSKTEVSGKQIKDASVQRVDLDVTSAGQSVITKVVAGDNISISSTGVDAGTGDVTISLGSAVVADITSLQSDVTSIDSSSSSLDSRVAALESDATTKTYVDQKVADLVNAAPGTLDTLNELAAALGDDPNFASTVAGQISTLQSDVADLESSVSAETSRAETAEGALDTRVVAVEGSVSSISSDVSGINTRVTALENEAAPPTQLLELTDVSIASPANGEVLQYNGTAWVNGSAPSTFSGSYTDLTDKPSLAPIATSGAYADLSGAPAIPGDVSDLTDTTNLLFSGSYTDLSNKPTLFSGSYTDLSNKPTLFDGSYLTLTDKPTLFSGSYTDLSNKPTLFSGSYNDLTSAPVLATVATSGSYNDLSDKPSFSSDLNGLTDVTITTPSNGQVLQYNGTAWINGAAPSTFSGSYNDLSDKPSLFSGSYTDLTSKPTLFSGSYADLTEKPSLFDGAYSSLTGAPSLASVATSGSYDDLSNKPTIPSLTGYATQTYVDTKVSDLIASAPGTLDTLNELATALGNDANFSTTITNALAAKANTASLATVATSGSYADLSDKPTLASFATLTSPASGNYLRYNGSAWVNSTIQTGDLPVANGSTEGIVSAAAQSFNGLKSFTQGISVKAPWIDQVAFRVQPYSASQTGSLIYVENTSGGAAFTVAPTGATAITLASASAKGLVVKGAASQSANLIEVQNSAGTTAASIGVDGQISGLGLSILHTYLSPTTTGVNLSGITSNNYIVGASNARTLMVKTSGIYAALETTDGTNSLFVSSVYGISAQNVSGQSWAVGLTVNNSSAASTNIMALQSVGANKFVVDKTGAITTAGNAIFTAPTAATKGLVVKGAASQSANLVEAQDSSGTAVFAVTPSAVETSFNGITSKETNATVTTANATETTLFSLTLADNTTYNLDIAVVARLSSAASAKGMYGRTRLSVYRNNGGGATLAADFGGQLEELDSYGSSGYDYVVDVSGNDVRVRVTGAASETVKWAANVRYVAVS